ncbi:hypothetical protein KUV57_11515 [Epibacterium sp. DP7N7-1]|nr:hypothetical protein [Epibacterium sp. DP7N7-1]
MTTLKAENSYTVRSVLAKNPTLDNLIDAVYALPEDLRPEYWFHLEPRPKSKRIYLKDKEEFREALQSWGRFGVGSGFMTGKQCGIWFGGFVPQRFLEWRGYHNHFDVFHKMGEERAEGRIYPQRAFEHFARYFDSYHAMAMPIRAVEAIEDARKAVFEKSPPFADYYPDNHTGMVSSYAHAKFRFPMLGWITYLSDELITDYALDIEELRSIAWRFEEVSPTTSAGTLYRAQFWEHRDDWQGNITALTDICLRADQYRYREEEWREEYAFKKLGTVEHWHEWLLPDRWWER